MMMAFSQLEGITYAAEAVIMNWHLLDQLLNGFTQDQSGVVSLVKCCNGCACAWFYGILFFILKCILKL